MENDLMNLDVEKLKLLIEEEKVKYEKALWDQRDLYDARKIKQRINYLITLLEYKNHDLKND